MMTRLDDLDRRIVDAERASGIRGHGSLSVAAIRRRSRQVAALTAFVLFALVASTLVYLGADDVGGVVDARVLRAAMILLSLGFLAYAWERDVQLRRLAALGAELRDVHLSVADGILREAAMATVEDDLHASLVLEDVLDHALHRVRDLVDAGATGIRLLGADGCLRLAAVGGNAHRREGVDAALAERAARVGELMRRPDGGAMAVPLVHEGRLLGVLEVGAPTGGVFDVTDGQIVSSFAPRVAIAVHNSRLYEDALVALERADV
ncbi:MAG TPA: GAF domain-containing protein [Acidimicrobiia bacterium]|nr:GAF domain-containing protein [Acidimicrobiia bacterium]